MRKTLFMHIAKCGGTSVLVYMRNVYDGRRKIELRLQDNSLQTVREEDIIDVEYIWLHEPLRLLNYNTDAFFKFTFLREPLERLQSEYSYLRDPTVINAQNFSVTPESVITSLRAIEHMSFEEFVCSDDPYHAGRASNYYARCFSQYDDEVLMSRDKLFSHCKRRMETCFDYIGLTSKLTEDVTIIKKLCFPECELYFGESRENISTKNDVDFRLSSSATDILHQKLDLDLDIYRHACAMREKKYSALVERQ